MSTFEIMFDDLKPEAQQKLLEFEGVQSPSDCNYEIVPVCVLERDDQGMEEQGGVSDA